MLQMYEEDKHTGMNIRTVAEGIYRYTAGYPYLVSAICKILDEELIQGESVSYNPDNQAISLAHMFGYIVDRGGAVRVADQIFEMRLYNFFLSEEELTIVEAVV